MLCVVFKSSFRRFFFFDIYHQHFIVRQHSSVGCLATVVGGSAAKKGNGGLQTQE